MHISTGSSTNPININNNNNDNNNNTNTSNNNGTTSTTTTTTAQETQVLGQDDNTEMNIDDLMNLTKSSNNSQDKSDDKMDIDNPLQLQVNLSQIQIKLNINIKNLPIITLVALILMKWNKWTNLTIKSRIE